MLISVPSRSENVLFSKRSKIRNKLDLLAELLLLWWGKALVMAVVIQVHNQTWKIKIEISRIVMSRDSVDILICVPGTP